MGRNSDIPHLHAHDSYGVMTGCSHPKNIQGPDRDDRNSLVEITKGSFRSLGQMNLIRSEGVHLDDHYRSQKHRSKG